MNGESELMLISFCFALVAMLSLCCIASICRASLILQRVPLLPPLSVHFINCRLALTLRLKQLCLWQASNELSALKNIT